MFQEIQSAIGFKYFFFYQFVAYIQPQILCLIVRLFVIRYIEPQIQLNNISIIQHIIPPNNTKKKGKNNKLSYISMLTAVIAIFYKSAHYL